jgi:dTDP-4-dehydrorhamnose reductase
MGKLILGDGLLGKELIKQTDWDYISRKKDNLNINNLSDFIPKGKYDTIINCIANTDTYSDDKEKHWKVNYIFVNDLINFCNENNIKLIHVTTDYIYTNSTSNASETDVPVHNNSWYGYTKLLGDGLVQLLSKNYLIIRCTHKPNPFPYDNAWVDQIGNFDYVDVISELIIKLVNKDVYGVYNVGTEVKSIFDLAVETKDVNPIYSPESTPKNVTMNINKLKSLNL